jgi:hypothetical protein
MDLKSQIIHEYLTQGGGFRKLAEKYGIIRTFAAVILISICYRQTIRY